MSHSSNPIFALDIGTRSVVGIMLEMIGDKQYKILGYEMVEHDERSMLDGQIHDVVAVAEVIGKVKEKLEAVFGPLEQVAVAAAGRSLKTKRIKSEQSIAGRPPLTREEILALELSAVQEAQRALAMEEEKDRTQYYCVGYSVVNYYLDSYVIGNLIEQRGETASVEVIATFLPRIVVDNLIAALRRAGLSMSALTLEPIAAIHVLIPPTMRRLNIALVDIGAGTSDIAITSEGTITAYGMVPVAGDEITDALMQAFLLDFPIAERVKRELQVKDRISFTDVLGFEHQLSRDEIIQAIREDVVKLAQTIGTRIIELNGKAPQAIILIGGGSLTPGIGPALAHMLGLPEQRVAIRGVEAIHNLLLNDPKIKGPEMVTPIGIAVTAKEHPVKYLTVEVNNKTLRLFDLRRQTIGDALIALGMDMKRLHGRPGLALTVFINQKMKMFPGSHGEPPIIRMNGREAYLDTEIHDGDQIEVIPGNDGTTATISVKDVVEEITTLDLYINDLPRSIPPVVMVNGEAATWDTQLKERDQVELRLPRTLAEIKDELGLKAALSETIHYQVNGNPHQIEINYITILINGKKADWDTPVQTGDRIQIIHERFNRPILKDLLRDEDYIDNYIQITFNEEMVKIPITELLVKVNGQLADMNAEIRNGDHITIEQKALPHPIYSDVFRYVEYTAPTRIDGGSIRILRNGEPASLDEPLQNGDQLEIKIEVLR